MDISAIVNAIKDDELDDAQRTAAHLASDGDRTAAGLIMMAYND